MMSLDPRKNDFFISPQLSKGAADLTESHSEEEAISCHLVVKE